MKKLSTSISMGLFSTTLIAVAAIAMFTFNSGPGVMPEANASYVPKGPSFSPVAPPMDLDYIFEQVAKKYTDQNNPCDLAAVGAFYDTTLQGLTAESVKLAFNQAIKAQSNLGPLDEKREVRSLLKGTSVLNISDHQIRDYTADHRPGDINFILKGCRL